ncbi:MAG: GWxTD domain-containing protein [Candidatus Eisenbacteria bacterium]
MTLAPGLAGATNEPREDGSGPLPWRLGGPLRFTVDGATFPDSVGAMYEVYVRVPPATLEALADADSGGSVLHIETTLHPRSGGGREGSSSREFTLAAGDTGGVFGKVFLFRFPVRSGRYRLTVQLIDQLSQKRGLAYVGRKVTQHRKVEGEIVVSTGTGGRELADPEFGWMEAQHGAAGAFEHGELAMLPDPDRLYGLLDQRLLIGIAARSPDPARAWHWTTRVLDATGAERLRQEGTGAAGTMLAAQVDFDLSPLPAGGYTIRVEAAQEGDSGPIVRTAHFEIAWQPQTWYRDPEEIADEMHFIMDRKEEDRFEDLGPGGREAFIDEFWRLRDPDPDTAVNEARLAYLERIAFANRTWSRAGLQPGMFTDMGRVLIRYGQPDEIERQVVPAGDQDLSRVQEALNEAQGRPTGVLDSPGPGGDQRPWELWIYEEGWVRHPLAAPRDAVLNPKQRHRLLFLFVDEQGYGDFRLRFSTE